MIDAKSAVIEQFALDHAEAVAACRFFHNDNVEQAQLLAASRERLRHVAAGKHVLVVQDTSEINYTAHSGALRYHDTELGPLGKATDVGFFVHPSLALDAETGFPLGLAEVTLWNRSWQQANKHERAYQEQPIEEKESYRWIESSRRVQVVLAEAEHVTIIADREGDIYTWFAQVPDSKTDLLVRSRIDRRLSGGGKLYARLKQQAPRGAVEFSVRSQARGKKREVACQIRFVEVHLARPRRLPEALPAALQVWAVEVREQEAPPGEEPVLWRLLTTAPVETFAEALLIVSQYCQRWQVEQFFRTLKRQGLMLESSQLRRGAALKKLALVAAEAALVVMQLVAERDGAFSATAPLVFSAEEVVFLAVLCDRLSGRTLKQQNPYAAGTLAWASWVIARLGGWKCYGAPAGPIRMSRGLRRFADQYEGWRLRRPGPPLEPDSENRASDVYGD